MFFARVDKYNFFGNTITGVLKLACTQKLLAREIFKVGARILQKNHYCDEKIHYQIFFKVTTLAMILRKTEDTFFKTVTTA